MKAKLLLPIVLLFILTACGDDYLNCDTEDTLKMVNDSLVENIKSASSISNQDITVTPSLKLVDFQQINKDDNTRECKYTLNVSIGETTHIPLKGTGVVRKIDRGTNTHTIDVAFDIASTLNIFKIAQEETKLFFFQDKANKAGFSKVRDYVVYKKEQERLDNERLEKEKLEVAAIAKAKYEKLEQERRNAEVLAKNLEKIEYEKKLKEGAFTKDELMKIGKKTYLSACAACHQPSGTGLPPAFPALKGSKIANGDISTHIDIVVNGSKKNPAMTAFKSQLTEVEIAAVITYERNSWGNNTGDLVQPLTIYEAKKK